jgi:hypothetical protein
MKTEFLRTNLLPSTAAGIIMMFLLSSPGAPTDLSQTIYTAAKKDVGKQMWKGYGLSSGTLGCAAALSNVLKQGGVDDAHSAAVIVVRNQLLHGKTKAKELVLRNSEGDAIDEAKMKSIGHPGDVVLAFMKPPPNPNGGPNAHCGILGENGEIYTNDWNDGIWKEVNIHLMFDSYPYIRLIRLQ